ncbi:MAG: GSU2204 family outer membrane beta-barrel protein, partial [Thermodesulfobacteriota bacterium]|nr:GSU2204 family outer membrane beta-barrel protein [Thermodesulfobacteriota bacterium]
VCDIAEYESSVHTLAINANIQVTEKLEVEAGVTYNKAESEWDMEFADRSAFNIGAGNGFYTTWDMNNLLDEYSDLSYEQYQFTAGGTYNFTEAFYTTASFTYDIFDMQEEYVYGDEDGTAYYGYVGFGWNF